MHDGCRHGQAVRQKAHAPAPVGQIVVVEPIQHRVSVGEMGPHIAQSGAWQQVAQVLVGQGKGERGVQVHARDVEGVRVLHP